MGEPVTHGRSLQKLGREIAEELDAMRDETVLPTARERLFERKRSFVPVRRAPARTLALGLAFAAALGAAAFFVVRRPPETMAFHIGDSPERGSIGAWVAASSGAPVTLRFDDGSRFDVEPSARARVASATLADARLLLESGEIHGDVAAHDKAAAWHVTAGPFDVAVGGTAFRMSWDPASETLDVRDVTDKVVVTGPYATRGVAVRRGEYLRVSMKLAKLEVSAAAPPPPAPPASSP